MKTKTKRTKLWIGLAVGLLAIAATIFTAAYLLLPSGYLGIDVNPSIEIQTNRLGKVTSVQPANADAAELLYGYRITDNDLDDVVEDLVDMMILKGYITAEGPNDVLITVGSDAVSQDMLDRVNQRVAGYLAARQLNANVMGQQVELDASLQQSASESGVSAGRMALIEKLLNGGTLTRDELAQMTIADLVAYARENNISLDILEDRLDELDDNNDDQHEDILDDLEDDLDDLDDDRDDDDDLDDDSDDWDDDLDDDSDGWADDQDDDNDDWDDDQDDDDDWNDDQDDDDDWDDDQDDDDD